MSIVLCCVDATEAGTTVMTAGEATGAPLLLVHIANSLWGTRSRRSPRTPRPSGSWTTGRSARGCWRSPRRAAPAMIVLGTRAKRWQSVARYVAKRASCPVMIVGPAADPEAEAVTRPAFDRALLRRSPVPAW